MKTPDKYRFTLQWGAETAEKIQAGDFLENLGNRKSEFVVLAVSEYLAAHPDVMIDGRRHQIVVKPSYTEEQLRAMVVTMIEERFPGFTDVLRKQDDSGNKPKDKDTDVGEMLKNLELFD